MRPIELDVEKINRISKQKENENYKFRSFLKGQDSDRVDKIAHRLYKEIAEQIDCTDCGNCCKILRPCVTDAEIDILSKIDNLSQEDFVTRFTEQYEIDHVKYLKNSPCKYFEDKKCAIYTDRPFDCRSYPHLHKKCFNSRTLDVINNYGICPIVFNVFERLKVEFRFPRTC
jgi:Fe-S-cluster containining protein